MNNGSSVVSERQGKSGCMIFSDGHKSTRFYPEPGREITFFISIPAELQWENQIGYALESSKQILHSMAEGGLKVHARLSGVY